MKIVSVKSIILLFILFAIIKETKQQCSSDDIIFPVEKVYANQFPFAINCMYPRLYYKLNAQIYYNGFLIESANAYCDYYYPTNVFWIDNKDINNEVSKTYDISYTMISKDDKTRNCTVQKTVNFIPQNQNTLNQLELTFSTKSVGIYSSKMHDEQFTFSLVKFKIKI
jgi:hypothetical protein